MTIITISSPLKIEESLDRLQSLMQDTATPVFGVTSSDIVGSVRHRTTGTSHYPVVNMRYLCLAPGGTWCDPEFVGTLRTTDVGSQLTGHMRPLGERGIKLWFIGVLVFMAFGVSIGIIDWARGSHITWD